MPETAEKGNIVKRTDMVRRGTQRLFTAENSIEQALRDVAGLTSDLSDMRLSGNLSVMFGQNAVTALADIMTSLADARGQIINVHKALNEVKTGIGCGAMADGTMVPKPPDTGDTKVLRLQDVA